MIANCLSFVKRATVSTAISLAVCAPANAQSVSDLYYNSLDATTKSEAATFVQMYAQLLETGVPAAGADTFAYTDLNANTPLFSPYIGYMRTLADIYAKDKEYIGNDVTPLMIVDFALNGKITTSISDPTLTINHLIAVSESQSAEAIVEGGEVVSNGVSTKTVTSSGSLYLSPDPAPAPQLWMNDLATYSSNLASSFNPADDIQHLLLGQPTNADDLADNIQQWLEAFVPDDGDLATYVIHSAFGKFGALPVVVISYEDGYLFANGMSGVVSGPYHNDDELDTTPLLNNTPQFVTNTSFGNIDLSGVSVNVVLRKRWTTRFPAGYVPDPSCTPAGCWLPRSPTSPTGTPHYHCVEIAGGKCKCTSDGTMTSTATPPGPSIPVRITCTTPVPTGGCGDTGTPPALLAGTGVNCTTKYFYNR